MKKKTAIANVVNDRIFASSPWNKYINTTSDKRPKKKAFMKLYSPFVVFIVEELFQIGFEWEWAEGQKYPTGIVFGFGDSTVYAYLAKNEPCTKIMRRAYLEKNWGIKGSFWEDDSYLGIDLKNIDTKSYEKLLQIILEMRVARLAKFKTSKKFRQIQK